MKTDDWIYQIPKLQSLIPLFFVFFLIFAPKLSGASLSSSYACAVELQFPAQLRHLAFRWRDRQAAMKYMNPETGTGLVFVRLPAELRKTSWINQLIDSDLNSSSLIHGGTEYAEQRMARWELRNPGLIGPLESMASALVTSVNSGLAAPEAELLEIDSLRLAKALWGESQLNNRWHKDNLTFMTVIANFYGLGVELFLGKKIPDVPVSQQILNDPNLFFELPPGWLVVINGDDRKTFLKDHYSQGTLLDVAVDPLWHKAPSQQGYFKRLGAAANLVIKKQ